MTLGYTWRCRPRSAADCPLPRATWNELQSHLQMTATCAGLGGAQERPSYEPRLLYVVGLGPVSEKYRACWGQVLLVWEVLGKYKAWAKTGHLFGKNIGNRLDGPEIRVGWNLRESQGWVNSVSQVDKDTDMAPACWFCEGRVYQRNNGLYQHFCLGESCPPCPKSYPDAR